MDTGETADSLVDFCVDSGDHGCRLDVFLATRLPARSRSRISRAIQAGEISVNASAVKPSYRLSEGDQINGSFSGTDPSGPAPENIPLDILHEDESLIVVNKAADMVVHPSRGHAAGTLAGALKYHFQELSDLAGPTRPGIVHRLDRDTTGIIVVAKNDLSHQGLATQFEARSVKKEYLAIVHGRPDHDRDLIKQPIGPHPNQRAKMAIRKTGAHSRSAETFYEVKKRYQRFSVVRVSPRTGRTHQIRVHLAHIRCPVICDRLYSGRSQISHAELAGGERFESSQTMAIERQALHAASLIFLHPRSGVEMKFVAPLPKDMETAIECLEQGAMNED